MHIDNHNSPLFITVHCTMLYFDYASYRSLVYK